MIKLTKITEDSTKSIKINGSTLKILKYFEDVMNSKCFFPELCPSSWLQVLWLGYKGLCKTCIIPVLFGFKFIRHVLKLY